MQNDWMKSTIDLVVDKKTRRHLVAIDSLTINYNLLFDDYDPLHVNFLMFSKEYVLVFATHRFLGI